MSSGRSVSIKLIWAAAKKIEGGEERLRRRVRELNDRDRTNQEHVGKDEYSSTKLLSDQQMIQLAHDMRRAAGLPAPQFAASDRPRGPRGGRPRRASAETGKVAYVATPAEREYLAHLFELLEVVENNQWRFIQRQTKGAGLTTHAALTACIAPLERMLRARGFEMTERNRIKRWFKTKEQG